MTMNDMNRVHPYNENEQGVISVIYLHPDQGFELLDGLLKILYLLCVTKVDAVKPYCYQFV